MSASKLNLSITAGLQQIKIFILKTLLCKCAVFSGTLFSVLNPHIHWYILVYGTKKERTKLPSRFFLPVMASSTKVDALKTLQYYDKKKLPDLQDDSYKKNIHTAFQ